MSLVRLIDVSFSYRDSVPILTGVSLHFALGWTGLVGPNGVGKSTLLRLAAGEIAPERGHVKFDPPGLAIQFCRQTAESLTADIEPFAAATDGVSRRVRGGLGLDPGDLQRWSTLSPGERKRWQVGAALAAEPGLLMLDEPTDHLDSEARALLLEGLRGFGGIGLIVSHDRALLNELTSHTVRVHGGTARSWRGSYDCAKRAWEAEEREYQEAHGRLRGEERKLARRLADKRRMAATAEAQRRRENRVRGLFDHQVGAPARTVAGRVRRDITVLRRKTERIARKLGEFRFRKHPGRSLFVDYVPAPASRLLTLDVAELRAGDKLVLEDLHLMVMREGRIRVAGPNGIGKSTLLGALLAHARVPVSRLLYLPQELHIEESMALLDSVRELCADERERVLTLVAALGVEPGRLLESRSPSPGEARKLKIAYGLGRQVWGLVLDEPTNHLDMPAIERLEEALEDYPGALVMVTHDEVLARRCITTEWRLADRRVLARSL